MNIKDRIARLESKLPSDQTIEVLGVKIKESKFHEIMRSVNGTPLRPRADFDSYANSVEGGSQ